MEEYEILLMRFNTFRGDYAEVKLKTGEQLEGFYLMDGEVARILIKGNTDYDAVDNFYRGKAPKGNVRLVPVADVEEAAFWAYTPSVVEELSHEPNKGPHSL